MAALSSCANAAQFCFTFCAPSRAESSALVSLPLALKDRKHEDLESEGHIMVKSLFAFGRLGLLTPLVGCSIVLPSYLQVSSSVTGLSWIPDKRLQPLQSSNIRTRLPP